MLQKSCIRVIRGKYPNTKVARPNFVQHRKGRGYMCGSNPIALVNNFTDPPAVDLCYKVASGLLEQSALTARERRWLPSKPATEVSRGGSKARPLSLRAGRHSLPALLPYCSKSTITIFSDLLSLYRILGNFFGVSCCDVSFPRNVFFYAESFPTSLSRTHHQTHWPLASAWKTISTVSPGFETRLTFEGGNSTTRPRNKRCRSESDRAVEPPRLFFVAGL